MGESFADAVTDGPLVVAALVSALVGLISFASPCVLPLVPGYLSYVGGLVGTATPVASPVAGVGGSGASGTTALAERTDQRTAERTARRRTVLGAVLFVLGFTVVFVLAGTAFGGLGRLLAQYSDGLTRVLGVVVIVVGLGFLGLLPFLQRTARLTARPAVGLAGAPLLGVVFGLGWTPCLGPTLGAVLSLSISQGTAGRGAFLAVAYCVGLGVPFVLVAMGARWAVGATAFLRRHARAVTRVGGAVLLLIGVLQVTGAWTALLQHLQFWLANTGLGANL